MSAAAAEMDALSARLNSVLRLGSGWMIQCDAIRSMAPGYPEHGAFPDPITRVIDDERRQQFMQEGAHFESEYFLTLTYPAARRDGATGEGMDVRGRSGLQQQPNSAAKLGALSKPRRCIRKRLLAAISNGAPKADHDRGRQRLLIRHDRLLDICAVGTAAPRSAALCPDLRPAGRARACHRCRPTTC